MKKRITSVLLTLAMLLSLVPAMGTTAFAAETESHPTAVGALTKGTEACYYRIYPDGTGKTVTWLGYEHAPSDNVATNWDTFKNKIGTYYKDDTSKKIDGVAYYDQDSGVLYVSGCITDNCTAVIPSTEYSDVLTVIVDGDTIGNGGWHVEVEKDCLKTLNVEFRNNSTLTLQKCGNYTGSVLGVTGHNITGDVREQNRPVANAGDLTLSGSGTLKIDIPHYANVMYCLRAKNISVKDNVSLDIKTVGNTFYGKYGSEIVVRSAAIYCYEKLNIDTTGTVNIVAEKTPTSSTVSDRGSFNAFSNIDAGRFNLVNAQSVTLNVVEQGDTFVNLYGDYQQDWYNAVKRTAEGKGWTVTESEDATKHSYTVTMTRQGLSDAVLNVGSQEIPLTGAVTKGDLQVDGNKQALTIKVKVPAWLTTLYKADRVGYDFTASVYENGTEIFKKVNFNLTTPDSSDGTSTVTLTLTGDFMPTAAGKNYIVTFSITPKVKATMEKLESAVISGNWLLTAVEKKTEITSVKLTGDALTEGVASGPELTSSDTSYTVGDTSWNPSGSIAAGKEYYTTLTLTAKDGYVFPTDWTQLRNIISVKLGNTAITKLGLGLANGGKTLSLTVYATAKAHEHSWSGWKYNESTHWKECSICGAKKDEEAHSLTADGSTAPGQEVTYRCACGYNKINTMPGTQIGEFFAVAVRPRVNMTLLENSVYLKNWWADVAEIVPGSIKWYKDDETTPLNVGYEFKSGEEYKVVVQFKAKEGYSFNDSMAGGSSTGSPSGINVLSIPDYKTEVSTDNTTVTATGYYKGEYAIGTAHTVSVVLPTFIPGDKFNDSKYNYNSIFTVDGAASDIGTVSIVFANSTKKVEYDAAGNTWKTYNRDDSTSAWGTGSDASPDDLTIRKGVEYTVSFRDKTQSGIYDTTKSLEVTDSGNSTTHEAVFYTASSNAATANATYFFEDDSQIASVDLTVTAPVYGESPATNATGADDTKYTVGTPTWTDNDDTFGAKAYTVAIPVEPATGYSFADGCVYTVNGYTATYEGGKVSYTFPALTEPHEHSFGQWESLNGSAHMQTCSCGASNLMEHTFKATSISDTQHEVTCIYCDFKLTASHTWGASSKTDATFDAPGANNYKCSVCNATKSETIDKLVKIDTAAVTVTAPVRNGTPAWAEATGTTYDVANTEWNPEVSSTFAGGTVYTVKVELKASGSNRFTNATQFTVNGKTATVVGAAPTADGTEYVTLTYEFPATGTGSSSSGSGTGSTAYTVKVLDSKNGDVTSSHKTAAKGTTVTLTVSPDKGYTLDDLTVLDKNGKEIKLTAKNGKYTFTMPASNVEVEATFKAAKSGNPFVDVPSGAYYEDAVIWAVDKGVTSGTDATHFAPNGICTRAQAVTFLWRAAGSPAPKSTAMPFTDVAKGSYYEQAVLWAVENGITKGTSDTTFSPNATCSRAQIVTFLWRSQKSPAAGSVNPFTDVSADAYYADAVLWAVKENVTSGTTATTFSPNADCTRAQIVTFIYRALAE